MTRFLALDFEGTSREPRRGCPAQLGVALMEDCRIIDSDEFLIRPPRHYKSGKPTKEVDAYSLQVWGMTIERLEAEGISSTKACERLDRFVGKYDASRLPVVAYNASYDIECYRNLLFEGGAYDFNWREYFGFREVIAGPWHCAFSLARLVLGGALVKFDLDSVAAHLGFRRSGELHGALEDAILAGEIWWHLETGEWRTAARLAAAGLFGDDVTS